MNPKMRKTAASHRCRRRQRVMVMGGVLLILALVLPGLATKPEATATPAGAQKTLEELHYKVDVWLWQHALKARVRFQELQPGRYRAEVAGETQGFLSLLSGNWRGSFNTVMTFSQGQLLPLVYREESQHRGKKSLKEYRFDYTQKKVELWQLRKDKTMVKRWETTFTEPFYDPLTFFYNRRLNGAPVGQGGETVKFKGIPYPKPEEILLRVGPQTEEGRKIMLELENRVFENERSQVYALLDGEGIPTKAWTRVMMFGSINVEILPGGKRVKREEVRASEG